MNTKKLLLIGFTFASIVFMLGYWLTKQYGFDPPYVYLCLGMAFQLAFAPVIVIVTLIKVLLLHRRNSSQ